MDASDKAAIESPLDDTPIRVLVVDDSTLYRKVVRDTLAEIAGVEVVASAPNGHIALQKIRALAPDLVTLDLQMPELDGLGVLRQLAGLESRPTVIVLSALTSAGAENTTEALALGALDFVLKPTEATFEQNRRRLSADLLPKVKAYARQKRDRSRRRPGGADARTGTPAAKAAGAAALVVIGVSTGGPRALTQMLPRLPADLPAPILIVQHMPPLFTQSLAADLDRQSRVEVREAVDGELLRKGHVLIAPGGRQMRVVRTRESARVVVNDDPPERCCRPSVDYLFRSAARSFGAETLAIVMTGMGDDGVRGCRLLRAEGARIVAQDEYSSTIYGMPREVVKNGLADLVCPLEQLADVIQREVGALPCG